MVNRRGKKPAIEQSSTEEQDIPLEMSTVDEDPGEVSERHTFDNLCRELNMDTSTADVAWKSYTETRHKYTLEVSALSYR